MAAAQTLRSSEPLARHASAAAVTSALGGAWVLGSQALALDIPCPLLAATGVPCPFCGLTRLAHTALGGDVVAAATRDPFGLVLLVTLGTLAVLGVALRLGWTPRRWPSTAPVIGTLVIALGLHWGTTLLGGGFVDP